jgi:hypothetical protein
MPTPLSDILLQQLDFYWKSSEVRLSNLSVTRGEGVRRSNIAWSVKGERLY